MRTGPLRGVHIMLGLTALVAVGVRLAPWQAVFDHGTVYFFDGDCYLHIRKIMLNIAAFPGFVIFDHFDGFPDGTVALWPPVLDWLISLLSILSGMGGSAHAIEVFAALIPAVVGGLTVYAIYLFGRRVFLDETAALIGGALLSLMYGHVIFTVLGRPDNEMMEPLLALLMYASYLRLQGEAAGSRMRDIVLCALSAFTLLMFWRGGTLWVMLMWAAMLIDVTLDFITARQDRDRHKEGAMVFAALALMIAPLCVLNVWGRQNTFSFNVISWFHVAVMGGAGAVLYAYGWAARHWRAKGRGVAGFFFAVVLGKLGMVGTSLVVPAFRENVISGLGIIGIGRTDPWIQSIDEYRPLFEWNQEMLTAGVGYVGWFYWVMPLALGHILWRMWRQRSLDRPKIFLVLFVLAVIVLSALRIRFVHIMALGAALCGAYALMEIYRAISGGRGKQSLPAIAVTALVGVLLIYPSVRSDYALTMRHPGFSIKGYVEDAMLWMRANTPEPSAEPQTGRPAYGVMAMWGFAGWVEQVAQRPAVATLYGTETTGLKEASEFFLAENEADAVSVLGKTGTRYVIATQVIGDLPVYARVLGRNDRDYVETVYSEEARQKVYRPGARYMGLVSTALLLADGAGGELAGSGTSAVQRLRLIYESPYTLKLRNFPNPVSKLKIFEYVQGVSLNVLARPGAQVEVSSMVRTNLQREFRYALNATAGGDGVARFTLPYAMAESPEGSGLVTPYSVRSGAKSLAMNVSGGDVISGAVVRADLR